MMLILFQVYYQFLKGTLNAEKEGGHYWLETPKSIIDTSLMLVIDKSLKNKLRYIEEQIKLHFNFLVLQIIEQEKNLLMIKI